MRIKLKIITLIIISFLLSKCGEEGMITAFDYPYEMENKIDTLEVSYISWACSCANWINNDYFNSKSNYQNIDFSKDCFFIEAKNRKNKLPEKYHQNGYNIRLIGSFYKDKGISRDYIKPTSQKPEHRKVFKYSKFEVIGDISNIDTKDNQRNLYQNANISDNTEIINRFISANESNLQDIHMYAKDTVLLSGWKINYLLKNNIRKDKDIYIRISKGTYSNTYLAPNVLEYRRYFIPTFLTETNDRVVFDCGCATDCYAILSMSKKDNSSKEYLNVVEFNAEKNILVYITNNTFIHEDKIFEIGIVNFNTNTEKLLTLNKMTSAVFKPSAIDTIIYKKNKVVVITDLRESINADSPTKKISVIEI